MHDFLDRWFHLQTHGSSVRREVLGGLTTFATMAYIIVVNPAILSGTGIDPAAGTIATILAAVFGTLLMGLYANRPFAVAPYMGENVFIVIVVATYGLTAPQVFGVVFVSGVLFLLLTITGARVWLADAIPASLKHSFAVGIGLFLLFIGLNQAGIVAMSVPDAPLKIGDWKAPQLLTIAGLVLMAWLMTLRLPGAILIGIAAIALIGALLGHAEAPSGVVAAPWSVDLGTIAGQLEIASILKIELAPVLFTLFFMAFFDTLGTLYALGTAAELLDKDGRFPEVEKPMLVDALACMFSGLIGTSPSGAYIEAATGIRDGARTGLAAIVVALCFALALFFLPVIGALQQLKFAYAPALLIVGVLMLGAARHIAFDDLTEAVPAVAAIAMMVFTMNIANGLAAGLALHPVLKLLTGHWREIHPGTALLGAASVCYYWLGKPH